MERIIKIFRRVMLAVIIIPFMSVFAMPDYNSVFAVETPRFAGLTLWDKNGGYLTTDSAVDSEHLLSQNTTVNFGGSTVRYSISGSGDIVLSLGGGMTLGNNSRGNSIENSGNQTVTIQTGNLNLLGGVLTEGNLSFEGTLEEVDPFHDRIGASIGALSVNSQTGIVSEKGDVSIRNYKCSYARFTDRFFSAL